MSEVDNERQEPALVAALRQAIPALLAVYRFGSSVAGGEHRGSDLDLAFLATTSLDPIVRFDLEQELASTLKQNVDLVDLRAASPVMAMQVISTGVLLYDGDPAARGAFEDLTYGTYARLNEERRAIRDRVALEGTVYGR
jgi:predicted nucleotidyltransferase